MTLFKTIKRRLWARQEEIRLAKLGLYGLELYRYLQEYTGDENPWIENPYGVFRDKKHDTVIIANQTDGGITLLYQ